MNIIILEDKKGFRKNVEVLRFPPRYQIIERDPVSVVAAEADSTKFTTTAREVSFFPWGNPMVQQGINVQVYREGTSAPVKYLIWSNEHAGWWAPDHRGYVRLKAAAGRYSFQEASEIVRSANINLRGDIPPNEAMVADVDEE